MDCGGLPIDFLIFDEWMFQTRGRVVCFCVAVLSIVVMMQFVVFCILQIEIFGFKLPMHVSFAIFGSTLPLNVIIIGLLYQHPNALYIYVRDYIKLTRIDPYDVIGKSARNFRHIELLGLGDKEESNWSNFMKRNPLYDPRILNEIGRFDIGEFIQPTLGRG